MPEPRSGRKVRGRSETTAKVSTRLVEALELLGVAPLEVEGAAHVSLGAVGDEDAVDRRGGLDARRAVDRRPDRDEGAVAAAERADHDVTGVDADAHPQGQVVRRRELGVEVGEVVEHGQRSADGALGVVLVGATQPEDGHHRVADELLDLAAVLLDDATPAGEVGVDDGPGVLRVEVVGEEREADQVGEEHGDAPALLELPGHQGIATVAHGGERDVDHVVPERRPLLLERGDGTVQRDEVVGGRRGVHRRRA